MKEVFGYVRWVWTSWETWQKMFILAMLVQGFGWGYGGDLGMYISMAGLAVVFGYMTKWFMWDPFLTSWAKYKSHRNELLTTIKTSDSKE